MADANPVDDLLAKKKELAEKAWAVAELALSLRSKLAQDGRISGYAATASEIVQQSLDLCLSVQVLAGDEVEAVFKQRDTAVSSLISLAQILQMDTRTLAEHVTLIASQVVEPQERTEVRIEEVPGQQIP